MAEDKGSLALFDLPRRPGRPRSLSIGREYLEALRAAGHLQGEDRALMELGRRLAAEVDDLDDPKVLAALVGQLVGVLDRLGLSPKGRMTLALEQRLEEVNPLDELALIRQSRRTSGDDAG